MRHFREIFNVTLDVPNATGGSSLVVEGGIHATCLASSLPENS